MQEIITDAITGETTIRDFTDAEIVARLASSLSDERSMMVVSRLQARAALHLAGRLGEVTAMVATSNDFMLQLAWSDAQEFRRNSPTIAAMAAGLNMTDEAIDDLFRAGSAITF